MKGLLPGLQTGCMGGWIGALGWFALSCLSLLFLNSAFYSVHILSSMSRLDGRQPWDWDDRYCWHGIFTYSSVQLMIAHNTEKTAVVNWYIHNYFLISLFQIGCYCMIWIYLLSSIIIVIRILEGIVHLEDTKRSQATIWKIKQINE